MTILITGAFGFVGTNLLETIKTTTDSKIIAVDIRKSKNYQYDEFFGWDELEKVNWTETDTVIHLAGLAHDTKNTKRKQDYFDVNVGLTKLIFDFFLKSKASKFIFFSSVKAVADKVLDDKLTEDFVPDPQTPYGKSKLAAENFLLNQPINESKRIYILRPCMIHGPGNKGNLNMLYSLVKKGIPWPLGSFKNERSFTSIDNLIFIVKQLIDRNINPGTYHIADDETISTNQLIELIAESREKKTWIWKFNKNMIYAIAKVGDSFSLPINTEVLNKLTESYVVSNTKLKNELGIKHMPVRAEEGMRKTLASFNTKDL